MPIDEAIYWSVLIVTGSIAIGLLIMVVGILCIEEATNG